MIQKEAINKLIEDQYKIGFGEIRFILQNGKIYEIIISSRERVRQNLKNK